MYLFIAIVNGSEIQAEKILSEILKGENYVQVRIQELQMCGVWNSQKGVGGVGMFRIKTLS